MLHKIGALMTDNDAHVKRLYALAQKLGRLSGETHNLVNDLTRKIAAQRSTVGSINRSKMAPDSATQKTAGR
jgi:hypothetical protein